MTITAAELIAKVEVQGSDIAVNALLSVGDAFKSAAETAAEFLKSSVHMAADFQQSMTLLVTSAGESKSNLKLVGDGIMAMSVQTATSTADLAASMFNVESAGYHGASGLKILLAAAQGAKIENADLAQVTDALTTTMHDFLLPASQAINTMNSFREAASIGKMRMDDFTGAMRNVGPIAALAKIHLTDVEAALSVMSLEGDKGASAGTHLAQSLLNMVSPSTKAQKVLAEIGMTAQQVSDDMKKSLPDTLAIITDLIGKKFVAGSEAYNHALSDMFGGTRGLKAILELTGTNLKDFTNDAKYLGPIMRDNAKAVGGWADVQANANFQMDAAKMAVDTLKLKIGTALLPVLGQLFQSVTPTITAFTQWVDKSRILQDVAKTLSGWLGYVGQGFNDVFNPVNKVLGVMKPLTDSFDRATAIIKPLKALMTPLTDTFDRANGIINSTAKAVNPMADSFDRATSILKPLNTEVAKTPNTWVPFWTAMKNLREQIMHIDWGAIGKGLSNIGSAITKMDWGKVGQFFTDLGNNIKNIDWGKVGKTIQDIAIGLTKVDWGQVGTAIANIAAAMANVDWKKVGDGIKTVTEGLSKVNWGAIMTGIDIATKGIQGMFGMFNWVYDILLGHSLIPDLINGIVKWFASLPGKLASIIQGTVNGIVSWFNQLPGRISAIVSAVATNVVQGFQSLGGRALSAVLTFIGQVGTSFNGLISSAFGWGQTFVNNIISGIQSVSGNINATLHNLHIPGFAEGTSFAPGGMAVVGERGPEVMYVPNGAQIIPNHQLSQVSSRSSSSSASSTPIILQLDGYQFARIVMPHLVSAIRNNVGIVGA